MVMPTMVPSFGTTYKLTNISKKRLSANQLGIPTLEPGDSVEIVRSHLRPGIGAFVQEGWLSSDPPLPPDLGERADSFMWQDLEYQKVQDNFKELETKIVFDPSAPVVGVHGTPVEVKIFVQGASNDTNNLDIDEEVDVTVDSGKIVDVVGYVSGTLGGVGPVRAIVASGAIVLTVNRDTAGVQNISLANPKTLGLDVSDTHSITWS